MAETPLGPGTLKLGLVAETLTDFSCEILGGKVTHAYEEIGEQRTMLCGTVRAAAKKRTDGLAFSVENDLTAAGMYQFLLTNDLADVFFEYVPSTAGAASWEGKVQASLPSEIGADEFGSPIVSDVEWAGTGAFTFTAAGTTP